MKTKKKDVPYPYTVSEARGAVAQGQFPNIYHKELMLWLCDQVELLRQAVQDLDKVHDDAWGSGNLKGRPMDVLPKSEWDYLQKRRDEIWKRLVLEDK